MVEAGTITIPMGNRDFGEVRIGLEGIESKSVTAIDKVSNISAKINAETTENDYYDEAGKTTRKTNVAPSVEVTFTYSDSAVHKYILSTALAKNADAMTQVECDLPDGSVLSMIANIELDNFGPDGAPGDDAEYTVNFTYATGNITIAPKGNNG
jgi:hypothetical protein